MVYIFIVAGFVVLFFIGVLIGEVLMSGMNKKMIGTLNVVEWDDGTSELLLQLDEGPENFSNGEEISLRIHKTRRNHVS